MSSEHVQTGQEWLPPRADTWNQIIDAKNRVLRKGRGVPGPAGTHEPNPAVVKVKVSYDTPKGKVLELALPLLDELDDWHIWFNAEIPDLAQARVPAVLLEPIADGDIGRAQISGVCLALVAVSDSTHRYAVMQDGSDEFASAAAGPIRLLTPPTVEEGESQLLPVVLQPNDVMALGLATSLIPYQGVGSVELFSGREDSTGPTIGNCLNESRDIASGEPVKVVWVTNVPYIFPIYDSITIVVKPTGNIAKGSSGQCEVFQAGTTTGTAITAIALGAAVTGGKWATAFQEVSSGQWYVGPWECA